MSTATVTENNTPQTSRLPYVGKLCQKGLGLKAHAAERILFSILKRIYKKHQIGLFHQDLSQPKDNSLYSTAILKTRYNFALGCSSKVANCS